MNRLHLLDPFQDQDSIDSYGHLSCNATHYPRMFEVPLCLRQAFHARSHLPDDDDVMDDYGMEYDEEDTTFAQPQAPQWLQQQRAPAVPRSVPSVTVIVPAAQPSWATQPSQCHTGPGHLAPWEIALSPEEYSPRSTYSSLKHSTQPSKHSVYNPESRPSAWSPLPSSKSPHTAKPEHIHTIHPQLPRYFQSSKPKHTDTTQSQHTSRHAETPLPNKASSQQLKDRRARRKSSREEQVLKRKGGSPPQQEFMNHKGSPCSEQLQGTATTGFKPSGYSVSQDNLQAPSRPYSVCQGNLQAPSRSCISPFEAHRVSVANTDNSSSKAVRIPVVFKGPNVSINAPTNSGVQTDSPCGNITTISSMHNVSIPGNSSNHTASSLSNHSITSISRPHQGSSMAQHGKASPFADTAQSMHDASSQSASSVPSSPSSFSLSSQPSPKVFSLCGIPPNDAPTTPSPQSAQAATIIQTAWRAYRVRKDHSAFKSLCKAAAQYNFADSKLQEYHRNVSSGKLQEKQILEVSELLMRAVLTLDSVTCKLSEYKVVKKRLTTASLKKLDQVQQVQRQESLRRESLQ